MSGNFTLFKSSSSSGSGSSEYVQDVFKDLTLPATNNIGLTDNSNTNPGADFFANNDVPKYGVKTLLVRDLVKINPAKDLTAVGGAENSTYRVVWDTPAPDVIAYVIGEPIIEYKQGYAKITLSRIGDRMFFVGKFTRCNALLDADYTTTQTGSINRSIDAGGTTTDTITENYGSSVGTTRTVPYYAYQIVTSAQTDDLHSYQIANAAVNGIDVYGVEVFYPTTNVVAGPGTTYVNKTKVTSTVAATLAPISFGILGGLQTVQRLSNGYTLTPRGFSSPQSVAIGFSGTNLLTVQTGSGSSFPVNTAIYGLQGTSAVIAHVTNQSSDTLTVGPTLGFGVSTAILVYGRYGFSQTINPDFHKPIENNKVFDNFGWANGITQTIQNQGRQLITVPSASGAFVQIEGRMSALEFELYGNGIFHATFSINGIPAFGVNQAFTGPIKAIVMTDYPMAWNQMLMTFGSSMATSSLGFGNFQMYERRSDAGISYGAMASWYTLPTYSQRSSGSISATIAAFGIYQRVFADNLYFSTQNWGRSATTSVPGGVFYAGATTTSLLRFNYYGKDFGVHGGGTLQITLDGVNIGASIGIMRSVASEGFHTVDIQCLGATGFVAAIDYQRTQGELQNQQSFEAPDEFPEDDDNQLVPTGTVVAFVAEKAPLGWLVCDGSQVSRIKFAKLFDVIGTRFGSGDSSTTFTLPDLRGAFVRGWDNGRARDPDASSRTASGTGGSVGDRIGSFQEDELQSHGHTYPFSNINLGGGAVPISGTPQQGTFSTNNTGGNETRPVNIYCNYIIKY